VSSLADPARTPPRALDLVPAAAHVSEKAALHGHRCMLMPVISAEGGVGRSTLTLAVGGVIAHLTPRLVLAVDAAQRPFSGLRPRTEFRSAATTWDALQAPHMLAAEASAQLITQTDCSGLHILVAEEELTAGRRPLTLPELGRSLSYAHCIYGAMVVDLPPFAPVAAGAVANAAGLLVVCRATVTSLQHARRLLTLIAPSGTTRPSGQRWVVAVNETSPRVSRETVAQATLLSSSPIDAVVHVPYDPGLTEGPIDVLRLKRRTRAALVNLADALIPDAAVAAIRQNGTR
jgi:MinD-like ATPase involved in chromosome partitioning or flagellar assembly